MMPSVPDQRIDPALNRVPDKVRHVHLMGICGTGMGALAGMLQESGFQVTGSDANVYPPMSDFLAERDIVVADGYKASNLDPRPDLVIVGNVISRDNPEAEALIEAGIPYLSFPQALAHFFIGARTSLVVCGTHGKTTTSSLLASMLHSCGEPPSFMIGGIVQAFQSNYSIAGKKYFVAEGDEYDTAFFDKGPKFLHYQPYIAILTSIEFDHADIYADLEAMKESYRRLMHILPKDGLLVACMDDPVVREIVAQAPCRVVGYGFDKENEWRLKDIRSSAGGSVFSVLYGAERRELQSRMIGRHNGLNALAVIAVLRHLNLAWADIQAGLLAFEGVRRRQEVRGEVNGVTVIDDFAHHPTAVRETLASLKEAYGDRRLVAVFEPRTNSSRRTIFQEEYAHSFGAADLAVVKEPEPHRNILASEMFSSRKLAYDLEKHGVAARAFQTTADILECLGEILRSGDVVAILSNGGFDNIHQQLLDRLTVNAP